MRRGAMRWAAALILGAALANPAWASSGTRNVQEPGSLSRLWEAAATWLAGGWQTLVVELTSDRGSVIDPDGAMATSDHGPHTDPNSGTATADSDRGAMMDPDG